MPTGTQPFVRPTHDQCYQRFQELLAALEERGWVKHRIDTYTHPDGHYGSHPRAQWAIRHHHTAGIWEIHHEPMDREHPHPTQPTTTVQISRHQPLPTVVQLVGKLFGGQQ